MKLLITIHIAHNLSHFLIYVFRYLMFHTYTIFWINKLQSIIRRNSNPKSNTCIGAYVILTSTLTSTMVNADIFWKVEYAGNKFFWILINKLLKVVVDSKRKVPNLKMPAIINFYFISQSQAILSRQQKGLSVVVMTT